MEGAVAYIKVLGDMIEFSAAPRFAFAVELCSQSCIPQGLVTEREPVAPVVWLETEFDKCYRERF